jgi:hypothetical protein
VHYTRSTSVQTICGHPKDGLYQNLYRWALQRRRKTMETYIEQYQAKYGGVTLHTWTDVQGEKKENFYITGVSGTPVAAWFRAVLRTKHLADIADFPYTPSSFYE